MLDLKGSRCQTMMQLWQALAAVCRYLRLHQCVLSRHSVTAAATVACCLSVQVITSGALIMELAAVFVLGATIITYDYFSSKDSMSGMGYF